MGGGEPPMKFDSLLYSKSAPILLLVEWIPFGPNYLDLLAKRVRPPYAPEKASFLAREREVPVEEPIFDLGEPETRVEVRGYEVGRSIAFSAELGYEETGGRQKQEEHLGVRVERSGRVVFGASVVEVEKSMDKIAFDHGAFVIEDLVRDTSILMESLLTRWQSRFLELIHRTFPRERHKFVAFLTDEIVDQDVGRVISILDQPKYRAEVAQILHAVRGEDTLSDGTLLIWGNEGVILAGERAKQYQGSLVHYGFLHNLQATVDSFFASITVVA